MPTKTAGRLPPFEPQITVFSAANALRLAKLANGAYEPQARARVIARELGLPNFVWIDLTEQFDQLYGFAAGGDDYAVLAFRGTADLKDWMTNVNAAPTPFSWFFEGAREAGGVHSGFALAIRHCWKQISAAVETVMPVPPAPKNLRGLSTTDQRTLWVTGHSLGGALAVLAGAVFSMVQTIRPVAGIYTFGQPRIGLFDFCGRYDQLLQLKTFRFVNKEDLVPRVPFRNWDYADVGRMIHFDTSGTPLLESVQWRNFLSRSFESFKDFFQIATHFSPDVGDHDRQKYHDLVETHQEALDALFTPRAVPI